MEFSSAAEREAFWWGVVGRRDREGVSVRAICEQVGVSQGAFYLWQRRFRQDRNHQAMPREAMQREAVFVPVRLVDDGRSAALPDDGLVLELSREVRLRISANCDEARLRRVMRAALAVAREEASC